MGAVGAVLLLVALLGAALPAPALAQESARIDGTVLWISGQTLTLRTDIPVAEWYGPYMVPGPGSLSGP